MLFGMGSLRKPAPAWPSSLEATRTLPPQLNPNSPRFSPQARTGVMLSARSPSSVVAPAHRYSAADRAELARQQDFQLALAHQTAAQRAAPASLDDPVTEPGPSFRERAAAVFAPLLDALASARQDAWLLPDPGEGRSGAPTDTGVEEGPDPYDQDRASAERWLAEKSPRARSQLRAAAARIREAEDSGDLEAVAHAATSLRRALCSLADVVFPPRAEPWTDSSGGTRKVGPEQWKNRLIAFYEDGLGKSRASVALPEINLVAQRMDALSSRLGKGVHDDCELFEIRQLYSASWNLVLEVSRLAL